MAEPLIPGLIGWECVDCGAPAIMPNNNDQLLIPTGEHKPECPSRNPRSRRIAYKPRSQ